MVVSAVPQERWWRPVTVWAGRVPSLIRVWAAWIWMGTKQDLVEEWPLNCLLRYLYFKTGLHMRVFKAEKRDVGSDLHFAIPLFRYSGYPLWFLCFLRIDQLDDLCHWYLDFCDDHLYFSTQITKKHSTSMCYRIPGDSWGFPKITGYSERVTGDLKGFLGIAGVLWRKKPSATPIIYMFVWNIFLTIQPDPTSVELRSSWLPVVSQIWSF